MALARTSHPLWSATATLSSGAAASPTAVCARWPIGHGWRSISTWSSSASTIPAGSPSDRDARGSGSSTTFGTTCRRAAASGPIHQTNGGSVVSSSSSSSSSSTYLRPRPSTSRCTGLNGRRAVSYRTVPTPQPLPSSSRRTSASSDHSSFTHPGRDGADAGAELPSDLAFPRHAHPTAWEVLHLPVGASCREVKAAYYKLVKTHHPDSKEANGSSHPMPAKVHASPLLPLTLALHVCEA
jgi:hypothetical protein